VTDALTMDEETAHRLTADESILWHQRFELTAGVISPGVHDIGHLLTRIGFPADLRGQRVLDIGTCNGFAAFEAERRGARRVVAVDVYDPDRFGFDRLAHAYESQVEFLKASVYELPELLDEPFDHVLFLGVLYHLRHPLLAVDALYEIVEGTLYCETAVVADVGCSADFFPRDELAGDTSNWWAPSATCLRGWFETGGFVIDQCELWPTAAPTRGMVIARRSGIPEYRAISGEVPLRVGGR